MDAGDDAAILPGGACVTVDSMVEGVHFQTDADPADLAYKLLAVSVSDVLAMGALPQWVFMALSLPETPSEWVDAFAAGFAEACSDWQVHLAGGDTTGSPGPRFLSATLLGRVPEGRRPWLRSGAQPGDCLVVTGTLGDAGAGWLRESPPGWARAALDRPRPPIAFVRALPEGAVHAAMDLSDGLATDLPRLCKASSCGAWVDGAALPASPGVAADPQRLMLQTRGGEDYQLLLAVPPDALSTVQRVAEQTSTRVTVVGGVREEGGAQLLEGAWPAVRFSHFPGVCE